MGRLNINRWKSYADVEAHWGRGPQRPHLGKPIRSGTRLFKDADGCFRVVLAHVYKNAISQYSSADTLCTITPDSRLVFGEVSKQWKYSLSQQLGKLFELEWVNDRGTFCIVPMRGYSGYRWRIPRELYLKYKPGMVYDMLTGQVEDADKYALKPKVIDSDERKRWLKLMRTFRLRAKTAIKMDVLSSVQPWEPVGKTYYGSVNWKEREPFEILYATVADSESNLTEFLSLIKRELERNRRYYNHQGWSETAMAMKQVDLALSAASVPLRERLGVIIVEDEA